MHYNNMKFYIQGKELNNNSYSLTQLDNIHFMDDNGNILFGCDQEWYGSHWQRMAGCGPTVAATILLYLSRMHGIVLPHKVECKSDCIMLMESVWKHVTPSTMGVYPVEQLPDGVLSFAHENGFDLESFVLNIPKSSKGRPTVAEVVEFISGGLNLDCPVAFLNLASGKISNLDSWHWVTVVGIEADDQGNANLLIYDGAKTLLVDLGLWLGSTRLGGGFVYFIKKDK